MRPTLEGVLAEVRLGRVVRLSLSSEQKAELRDRDGQLALHLLRHGLAARAAVAPEGATDFPLTDAFIAALARGLGQNAPGIKRARRLRHRLIDAGVIQSVGSYRPNYAARAGSGTYRVSLFRLAMRVSGYVERHTGGASHHTASIGSRRFVKGWTPPPWWEHDLFGTPDKRPPPEMRGSSRHAKRMRKWLTADQRYCGGSDA